MGIIDKAKKLGLDIGDGTESLDNLRAIASQVGFSDFESLDDASKLDNILSEQLSSDSSDNIENLDNNALENSPVRNEKFGQREYDQAKKDGVYNKDHYKNKQSELDKKAEGLNEERHKDWKMKKGETGNPKADGSNVVRKSKMDRVMDNLNYAKAKKGALDNKIAGAKANAYNAMHPLETAKDKAINGAKSTAKDVGKKAAKKTGDAAKAVGKQAGKVVAKLGAKFLAFIAANPWILLIIGGVLLLFIIIVAIMGGGDENSNKFGLYGYDYYEVKNLCSTVSVYNPNTGEYTRELDFETEYIPGVVSAEVGVFSDAPEVLKIFAISARTYAISTLNSSCVIEGSARVQAFQYDETAFANATSENSAIMNAVNATYGLIVTKNSELMKTYYDAGCYRGEEGDNYLFGYGSLTLGSERLQSIPKSWVQNSGLMYYVNQSISNNKYCYSNHGYGISQYGSYYLAKEEQYDLNQLLNFYLGDIKLYSIYQGVSSNYTLATSSGSKDILTMSLREYLDSVGVSTEAYNEYLLSNIVNAGIGTRDGAVTAAVSLVGTLYNNFGVRLPYALCGQHACADMFDNNGNNVNKVANSFYGIDPDWGTAIHNGDNTGYNYFYNGKWMTYTRYGPDCSGFIAWILHNSGFVGSNLGANSYKSFGDLYAVNSSFRGKAGDLMWHEGHIMFIVGVDEEKQVYYIAHASSGSNGVKINTVSFSDNKNYIIDMTEWYQNNAVEMNENEFIQTFRNGYVDGYTGEYTSINVGINEDVYFVGDSRTVGMCNTMSICDSTSSCNTNMCYAEVGVGYSWFSNHIDDIENTSKNNIVVNIGVNDLPNNSITNIENVATNYYNKLYTLAKNNSNKKIYVMSVNPVKNYSAISDSMISSFNDKLLSLINNSEVSNLYYINAYNNYLGGFETTDGLHYTSDTYKNLYKYIIGVIKN